MGFVRSAEYVGLRGLRGCEEHESLLCPVKDVVYGCRGESGRRWWTSQALPRSPSQRSRGSRLITKWEGSGADEGYVERKGLAKNRWVTKIEVQLTDLFVLFDR